MRSRYRMAAAVSVGLLGTGSAYAQSFVNGNLTIRPVALANALVPTNPALNYTNTSATSTTPAVIVGEYFQSFNEPSINSNGLTAFSAVTNGSSNVITTGNYANYNTTSDALFSEGSGRLSMVAHTASYAQDRQGTAASGTSTDTTGVFANFTGTIASQIPNLDAAGTVTDLVQTKLNGSGGSVDNSTGVNINIAFPLNSAIYSGTVGSFALTSRLNDASPALGTTPSTPFSTITNTTQNTAFTVDPAGEIGTVVTTADGTNGFIEINSGVVTWVARGTTSTVTGSTVPDASGNPIAGTTFNASGGTYAIGGSRSPVLNGNGAMAFVSTIEGPGLTAKVTGSADANNEGLYSQAGGTLHLVLQTGGQIPGLAAGDVLSAIGSPDLNNAGQMVFTATVAGTQVPANYGGGTGDAVSNTTTILCTETASGLTVLARAFAASTSASTVTGPITPPGVAAGLYYTGFNAPVIGDDGTVIEVDNLTGTNNYALFRYSPGGTPSLLAATNQSAPGGGIYKTIYTTSYEINKLDEVAFEASVYNGSATAAAIFVQDITGTIDLVAEVGQQFEIAPGDYETISSVGAGVLPVSGDEDGRVSQLGDDGAIALDLTFTSGSQTAGYTFVPGGVFTVEVAPAAVPEPASAAFIGLAAAGLLRRRTRARRV